MYGCGCVYMYVCASGPATQRQKVERLVIYVEGEDDQHIEPHLVFQMYCEFGERLSTRTLW